jgi:hypothetical protein
MASGQVYQAIRDHLDDAGLTPPIAYENEDEDASGNALPPNPPKIYIRVDMTGTAYAMQSIGADPVEENRWDEEGILFLSVEVPKGEGALEGRTLAKQLLDLFRGQLLLSDTLEFGDGGIGEGHPSPIHGAWWRIPAWVRWTLVDAPIDGLE